MLILHLNDKFLNLCVHPKQAPFWLYQGMQQEQMFLKNLLQTLKHNLSPPI